MAGLKCKVKVEISIIFDNDLSFLDFINKDVSESHFALLVLFNRVDFSTEEN